MDPPDPVQTPSNGGHGAQYMYRSPLAGYWYMVLTRQPLILCPRWPLQWSIAFMMMRAGR